VTTGNIAEISYGTAAVIELLSSKYVTHPRMDFFTWGAAIPRHWALEGFVGRGYWMVAGGTGWSRGLRANLGNVRRMRL